MNYRGGGRPRRGRGYGPPPDWDPDWDPRLLETLELYDRRPPPRPRGHTGPAYMNMPPGPNAASYAYYPQHPDRYYFENVFQEYMPDCFPHNGHDDLDPFYDRNWTRSQNPSPHRHPVQHGPEARPEEANFVKFQSHPPTNGERYRLFVTMLRCGDKVHNKTYLAMYWLGFAGDSDASLNSPLFENDPGGHAEDRLLEHLEMQLKVVRTELLKSVTIMQNASPCSRCSEKYCKILGALKRENEELEITLVFSAFHWLRRLSCRHDNHRHKFISKERHEENREGLRNLSQKGVGVRTTGFDDWRTLSAALQIPLPKSLQDEDCYQSSLRGEEDRRLKEDLEEILR